MRTASGSVVSLGPPLAAFGESVGALGVGALGDRASESEQGALLGSKDSAPRGGGVVGNVQTIRTTRTTSGGANRRDMPLATSSYRLIDLAPCGLLLSHDEARGPPRGKGEEGAVREGEVASPFGGEKGTGVHDSRALRACA